MSFQDFVIPSWLDKAFFNTVLSSKYGPTCAVAEMSVSVATKKGDHYSSEMFRVHLSTTDGHNHFLILKQPHSDRSKSAIVEAYDFFGKEIRLYTSQLPALEEILQSVDEGEPLAPELFYCDPSTQVLILQDLSHDGYNTGQRETRVCRQGGIVFMRKLAKFHAASIILNQRLNGDLERVIFDSFCSDGPFAAYFDQHPFALVEEVTSWGEEFASLVPKLERIAASYRTLAHSATRSQRGLNVLVHGDPWYTNLLLKKDESGDGVEDVRMIDFQLTSWASLATDILNFCFRSLNEVDYEGGLDYLVQEYHGHISRVLKRLNYDKVPTLEDITAEIHDHFFHGEF